MSYSLHLITNPDTGEYKCGSNISYWTIYGKNPDGTTNYDIKLGKEKKISKYRGGWGTTDANSITCKRCLNTTSRTPSEKLDKDYTGKIFSCSWGYDMTINEYAKVIKQSDTTLTLQMCLMETNGKDNGMGEGKSWAGEVDPKGKVFRLRYKGNGYWTKALGHYWGEWDGKPEYYNTWD